MTTINFHKDNDEIIRLEAGCIVDEVHGRYAESNLVRFAMSLGYVLSMADASYLVAYESGDEDDAEVMRFVADDAAEWLNAHLEDGFVDWYEGNVFLEAKDLDTNA